MELKADVFNFRRILIANQFSRENQCILGIIEEDSQIPKLNSVRVDCESYAKTITIGPELAP